MLWHYIDIERRMRSEIVAYDLKREIIKNITKNIDPLRGKNINGLYLRLEIVSKPDVNRERRTFKHKLRAFSVLRQRKKQTLNIYTYAFPIRLNCRFYRVTFYKSDLFFE